MTMTNTSDCTATAHLCRCTLTGPHDAHVCACGGSWHGQHIDAPDFRTVRLPVPPIEVGEVTT